MQVTAAQLAVLPRADSAPAPAPAPAPAVRRTIRKRRQLEVLPELPERPPIAGCFVETTTAEKAARVHRNRQLAAKSLRNIKSSLKDLEARSGELKAKDAALSAQLAGLVLRLRER